MISSRIAYVFAFLSVINGISKAQDHSYHSWSCIDTDHLTVDHTLKSLSRDNIYTDTIALHIIIDNSLFGQWQHSASVIQKEIDKLFARVFDIYAHENIPLKIGTIEIDASNKYASDHLTGILLALRSKSSMKENITLFLTGQARLDGGIAFRGGLCDRSKAFAVSQVRGDYDPISSYSRDVHIIAHELGHVFGSPHTHECVWGPNSNQAIDGCSINDCAMYDLPSEGGTIMSYCQESPFGVELSNGFGEEPGSLIRQNYDLCRTKENAICLSATQIDTRAATVNISTIDYGKGASAGGNLDAKWYTYTPTEHGTIYINACDQGVDTYLNIFTGDCQKLKLVAHSDDDCHAYDGYFIASSIADLNVVANEPIWIEWSNIWSSEGFEFQFLFIAADDPCHSGMALTNTISQNQFYYSATAIDFNGMIDSTGFLTLMSPMSVELKAGVEIRNNGHFEILIGTCDQQTKLSIN